MNKFRDERGASMSAALLLFLVCAVVASIIIAAGSTAAGRISNLAKSDQLYYSLTSAAQLVRDELDNEGAGQPVTVEVAYEHDEGSTEEFDPSTDSLEVKLYLDGNEESGSLSVIEQATLFSLLGSRSIDGAKTVVLGTGWKLADGSQAGANSTLVARWNSSGEEPEAFWLSGWTDEKTEHIATMTLSGEGINAVTVTVSIEKDGNLAFIFTDANNTLSALKLTCSPDTTMSFENQLDPPSADGRKVRDLHVCTVIWEPLSIAWVSYPSGGGTS